MKVRALLVAGLALAGCGTVKLDPTPPPGFDLAGRWVLLEGQSESAPPRYRLGDRGSALSLITQDFPVLRAAAMDIEQHRDSMGIRYDVGDYQDVSWGVRHRGLWEVRAGWHEGQLMILSDAEDAKGREVLTLSEDGRRLTVDVHIQARGDDLDITRVFQRSR